MGYSESLVNIAVNQEDPFQNSKLFVSELKPIVPFLGFFGLPEVVQSEIIGI